MTPHPSPDGISDERLAEIEKAAAEWRDESYAFDEITIGEIRALCTLVRGASEDRARLDELQRVVAMCDRVEIHDNTDDWQAVLIGAGDEFGRGATIREALDDSITAYDEAMKIVAAARTPNQDRSAE